MDFVKKNIGLLLFLLFCVGVIIYEGINILEQKNNLASLKQQRLDQLKTIEDVKKANLRLDTENRDLAEKISDEARKSTDDFVNNLASKCILPGIDFTIDPDEPQEEKKEETPEGEENATPQLSAFERYKNNPDRIRFDTWMGGSLADARDNLTNEIKRFNQTAFSQASLEQTAGNTAAGRGQDVGMGGAVAATIPQAGQVAADGAFRTTRGPEVSEYFFFEEYCNNRPQGLKNEKERRGVFRQLILLEKIIELLNKAEVDQLEAINFPCGLEILPQDKYTSTPVSLRISGKPECIETFINLLNANEEYFFYLKDITSFKSVIRINSDSLLPVNNPPGSLYSQLQQLLDAGVAKQNASFTGGGARDMGAGPRMETAAATPTRTTRRAAGGPGGPDMMMDNNGTQEEELSHNRRAYRVFLPVITTENNAAGGPRGMNENAGNNDASQGFTSVSTLLQVSIIFEYVEFNPVTK